MSLNKFTYIPLLKNDVKLKKVTNNHTKKSNHPKFFIKIKSCSKKKITSNKNKYKLLSPSPKKSKEKKKWQLAMWLLRKKKKGATLLATLLPKKKKKKSGGQRFCLGNREERKKCNLNWGYLYKVHLLALFPPRFPPKLGG